MIYLIDDKTKRQKEFGWGDNKFYKFSDVLQRIYSLTDLYTEKHNIFQEGNVILYHESFLDNTSIKDQAQEKREELEEFANKHSNFFLAIYSGSKRARSQNQNIAYLPASIVFQNLATFSYNVEKGDLKLKYLLFGRDPDVEEKLMNKLKEANDNEKDKNPAYIPNAKNLFIRPSRENIQEPIQDSSVFPIYKDVSDGELSRNVIQWLTGKEFDNIFIPICFGPTLSDFNGLRLAAHIRCTETTNQLKNIFIYSFIGYEYFFDDEYSNILKTKNVQLIDHSKKAFENAGNQLLDLLKSEDLPKEIEKLKLDPPKNYEGKHSIANEWAIYQWSKAIGADKNEEISQVFENVKTNLYFKYLRTIYPVLDTNIAEEQLKIDYGGEPRVLLIDDESEKGWYEVFAQILGDLNNIYTDYIGENFKGLTPKEIVSQSIQKISDDGIDVVILDLRLSDQDFDQEIDFKQFTGNSILKEIKILNRGIQVIITTASNKFWNYESTIQLGADGYIIKRGDFDVSRDIKNFKTKIENSINRAKFLKKIHNYFTKINELVKNSKVLNESYQESAITNLEVAFKLLESSFFEPKYWNYAYLQIFLLLEEYLSQDNVLKISGDELYVIAGNQEFLVLNLKDCAIKWKNGHYIKEKSKYDRKVDTNFKMSAILLFRHNCNTSGDKKWTQLNEIRNHKAAHPEDKIVTKKEIKNLVEFALYIIDENNIYPCKEDYSLPKPSIDYKKQKLQDKFNTR